MRPPEIQPPASPPWSAERLSFDAFVDAGEAWEDLACDAASPLPFMSHRWLCTWWRHFGKGLEFAALVLRHDKRLVAGIPLAIRRAHLLGLPVRVAEIVGTGAVPTRGMGLADKAEPPVRAGFAEAAAALAAEVMQLAHGTSNGPPVDLLDLKGLDAESPFVAALTRTGVDPMERSVSPYLPLTTWDDYLATRSGNFRKHLRKYRRLLEQSGRLEFSRLDPARDDPAEWMGRVFEADRRSWKAERGTDLFRHPRIRAFMLDAVEQMAREGMVDLQFLQVDERVLAFELCFDYANRLFSYTGSFDRDLRKESPGTALTAEVIRSACERGHAEYDLLRGDEGYKSRWSEDLRREVQLLVSGPRLRGRLFAACGPGLKARLKQSAVLTDLADRASGFLARWKHDGPEGDGRQ